MTRVTAWHVFQFCVLNCQNWFSSYRADCPPQICNSGRVDSAITSNFCCFFSARFESSGDQVFCYFFVTETVQIITITNIYLLAGVVHHDEMAETVAAVTQRAASEEMLGASAFCTGRSIETREADIQRRLVCGNRLITESALFPGVQDEVREARVGEMAMGDGMDSQQVLPLMHREIHSIQLDVLRYLLLKRLHKAEVSNIEGLSHSSSTRGNVPDFDLKS